MSMRSGILSPVCSGSLRMFQALLSLLLVRFAKMEEDQDLLQACVEDLQSIIDKDGDGDISRDEFVKNAANCKFITNLLSK